MSPAPAAARAGPRIEIDLSAAIVAVTGDRPQILVVPGGGPAPQTALPSGPFDPLAHRTMEIGLRAWVREQTGLTLGYVEQLYTFADRGRHAEPGDTAPHMVSVGYLALTRTGSEAPGDFGGRWRDWYTLFPWEDWRGGKPAILDTGIEPALRDWSCEKPTAASVSASPLSLPDRVRLWFGLDGLAWDEERALERYELLYEAGLIQEALRDGRASATSRHHGGEGPRLGEAMLHDHRRILATAIARLRAKLKYRPVIFEMMPESFTLLELQRTVECLLGIHLHKQNFRRLVEKRGLVQTTGEVQPATGGRPAQLYRFRREVLHERPSPGLRL
jgi:hypothetical protein